jgi:hypothetical protein
VNPFLRFKSIGIYTLILAFLGSSFACGYKPAYLQKGKTAEVSERWKVEKINPDRLSADENSVLETFGTPDYIRFYRHRSLEREKVYAWIYVEPARFVTFIDGKKVDYAVLDDDLSSLNEHQKNMLFWGGITVGTVAALGLLYYYFIAKK